MPDTHTLEITINPITKTWHMACDVDDPGQRAALIIIAIELLQNYLAADGEFHANPAA